MRLSRIHYLGLFLLLVSLVTTLLVGVSLRDANAQTPQELASKFSPASVDYIISSSALKLRASDGSSTLTSSNPTPSNLGSYAGSDLFLDNKLGTLDAIAADYAAKAGSIGYYAYVHIVTSGSSKVIQYWFFTPLTTAP